MTQKHNHLIVPTKSNKEEWIKSIQEDAHKIKVGNTTLDCNNLNLNWKDLTKIMNILSSNGANLMMVISSSLETIISASALGLKSDLSIYQHKQLEQESKESSQGSVDINNITFKKGTLRSGEELEAEGDILLLGDVNPGASISASGNVMVWGRLRGIAHAGKNGDKNSKIIALELRPVQLRIANFVARGPEEKPEQGFAEEAHLEGKNIVISPAKATQLKLH